MEDGRSQPIRILEESEGTLFAFDEHAINIEEMGDGDQESQFIDQPFSKPPSEPLAKPPSESPAEPPSEPPSEPTTMSPSEPPAEPLNKSPHLSQRRAMASPEAVPGPPDVEPIDDARAIIAKSFPHLDVRECEGVGRHGLIFNGVHTRTARVFRIEQYSDPHRALLGVANHQDSVVVRQVFSPVIELLGDFELLDELMFQGWAGHCPIVAVETVSGVFRIELLSPVFILGVPMGLDISSFPKLPEQMPLQLHAKVHEETKMEENYLVEEARAYVVEHFPEYCEHGVSYQGHVSGGNVFVVVDPDQKVSKIQTYHLSFDI